MHLYFLAHSVHQGEDTGESMRTVVSVTIQGVH